MKAHLKYASYVVRHKWFVFRAGLKTRAPIWRLLIHDWSKMSPAEWGPYVRSFYGKQGRTRAVRAAFDAAWLHHQHRNPHHWQHWLLWEDDGPVKALEMPAGLAREMVADWMGAGRAITGRWDVASWYEANRDTIVLAPRTRCLVDRLVTASSPSARCKHCGTGNRNAWSTGLVARSGVASSSATSRSWRRTMSLRDRGYQLRVWWYGLGLAWTERQCRRHGADHYSRGYPWLLRLLGWD